MSILQDSFYRAFVLSDKIVVRNIKNENSKDLAIYFEPAQKQQCEQVQRQTLVQSDIKSTFVFAAVYGIVQMQENKYLVVAEKAESLARMMRKQIFRVSNFKAICLNQNQNPNDIQYLKSMNQVLQTAHWYFSFNHDLTRPLQDQDKSPRSSYTFNHCWITDLPSRWITRFINGHVSINSLTINQAECKLGLITRMHYGRYGRKWILRGVDEDGYAANTSQSQIILVHKVGDKQDVFSLNQLRGQMPFLWQQYPDLKTKPDITIVHEDELNKKFMALHYLQIQKQYSKCSIFNLVTRKKNQQKQLGQYFQKIHGQIQNLFPLFNFYWPEYDKQKKLLIKGQECLFTDVVNKDLPQYGYYHLQKQTKKVLNTQKGVYRSNCLNSLDRTNVLQSFIAKHMLSVWLNTLQPQQSTKIPSLLAKIASQQWIQNGHANALINAGTKALRTQTSSENGKATLMGDASDILQKIKRRYVGNFVDPVYQDSIDFMLGKLKPKHHEQHRISYPKVSSFWIYLLVLLLGVWLMASVLPTLAYGDASLLVTVPLGLYGIVIAHRICQKFNKNLVRRPLLYSKVRYYTRNKQNRKTY